MITHKQNFGKLTDEQEHKLDCMLYEVSDKVYMFDPQPSYQIVRNAAGESIVEFENGLEHYLPILEVI